jgi:hypothetical protein
MLDAIDFGLISLAVLTIIVATVFIIVIWSAALGMPVF